MFDWLLKSLQDLDLFSMGIGIILIVLFWAIWRMKIWKKKPKDSAQTVVKK